jgi:hypothetical protein
MGSLDVAESDSVGPLALVHADRRLNDVNRWLAHQTRHGIIARMPVNTGPASEPLINLINKPFWKDTGLRHLKG